MLTPSTPRPLGRPRIHPARPARKAREQKRACANCGAAFPPTRPDHQFCGDNCRKEFHRYGGHSPRKMFPLIEKELLEPLRQEIRELRAALAAALEQHTPA